MARAPGGLALISWSGSLFEYLMPSLVMRAPAGSLLEQTNRRMTKSLLWRAFFYRDRWAIAHAETLAAWLAAGCGGRRERAKVRKRLAGILARLEETGVPVAVAPVERLRG